MAAASSLEVTLVNARTPDAPVQPQILAQQPVDGGGDALAGLAVSPLPHTGEAPDTVVLEALRRRQAELEAEQRRLLTVLQARRQVERPVATGRESMPDTASGEDDLDQDDLLLNAQIAALADRIQAYNQGPRRQFVAPSASQSPDAAYVDAWRTRVETIGTRHYPDDARGRVYGSLQMTVYIRADGSVADAIINQPAADAMLNLAARRIVQLAAPYPPFPPELAATTDVLAITRSWHFVNDAITTLAP